MRRARRAVSGRAPLRLQTDGTNAAKAGLYSHTMAGMPLADVTALAYWTKQVAAGFAGGDPSFQLQIQALGSSGFTTLVFEPYENGTVTPGVWEQWDVDAGQLWSSRTVVDASGDCDLDRPAPVVRRSTRSPGLIAICPDAVVVGIGVNVGSFNPGYDVFTDGVVLNDTTYDFEIGTTPSTKNAVQERRLGELQRAELPQPGRLHPVRQHGALSPRGLPCRPRPGRPRSAPPSRP